MLHSQDQSISRYVNAFTDAQSLVLVAPWFRDKPCDPVTGIHLRYRQMEILSFTTSIMLPLGR
jgi:hypothetical protein